MPTRNNTAPISTRACAGSERAQAPFEPAVPRPAADRCAYFFLLSWRAIVSLTTEFLVDGAAAMTAYGKLQFEEMSDLERTAIQQALLRYCELDSLAMVMIYEGWREMIYG